MALIEKLERRFMRLGLLPRLIKALPRLSVICALIGVTWLALILPMEGQYRRTYISENALMPSQAYSYFRETEWNILRGYRGQIDELRDLETQTRNEIVASWLQEFGTKTAVYRDEVDGDTLYGLQHAARGDGTEAMVLAAPWVNVDGQFNVGGVSLAISLLRFFSRWPVWSKNIVIVISDNAHTSLRSWVEAYHTSLDLTGGSIEAAVVLDYPETNDFFRYVEIFYSGLNGELPNLDLVNIAVHVTEHEGMKVALNGVSENQIGDDDSFSGRLRTLAGSITQLAYAGAQKCYGHEAFSGWRIQAITLRARGTDGPFDITTFGRIPEAVFRSVNNLLEKFHQSFFFYLLLAPRLFVSIGSYLPAAILLSVSFMLSSLDNLLNNKYASTSLLSAYNTGAFLVFAVVLFFSFLVSQVLLHFPSTPVPITASILASLLLGAAKHGLSAPLAYRFRSLAFLYFGLILTSLLVVNFALAFGISLLALPMTFVKNESDFKRRLKNFILLILSNPFIAVCLVTDLISPDLSGSQALERLIFGWTRMGSWTWFVVCLGWLPAWLLVALSTSPASIPPSKTTTEDKKNA
ncbi:LAMI_0H15544g1_1 [Lachancea mirantina]|uniref:LAMI_0H15544g1_1 n=1 Tax=Lachancea mirantina TaxID=1230905 RepID=A0A1G4KIX2_9SACH|nr:LAMI_0H15544g1_1 [Lachancea mirantina]